MTIGIIGTGFGKTIAQTFKAIDPGSIIFLSGLNKDKTKKIADEVSAQAIENWKDLITEPSIDLIVIAAPNTLHKKIFEAVIIVV